MSFQRHRLPAAGFQKAPRRWRKLPAKLILVHAWIFTIIPVNLPTNRR